METQRLQPHVASAGGEKSLGWGCGNTGGALLDLQVVGTCVSGEKTSSPILNERA